MLGLILLFVFAYGAFGQTGNTGSRFTIARVKYAGGGDWYNDPSIIPNLLRFLNQNTNLLCAADEARVELGDNALFSYPFIFLTGHGRIVFSDQEAERLRNYLLNGGFLYADDDYGMDASFVAMMKKVFPDKKFVELPFSHPVFSMLYPFPDGVPKIHEHDGGPGKTKALFHEGRMIVLYTVNTNISDGWADPEVHQDPEPVRRAALRFGANIVLFALAQ